jgi:hypothetical protein
LTRCEALEKNALSEPKRPQLGSLEVQLQFSKNLSIGLYWGFLPHPRLVIIEFSSRTAAEDWYNSAEYRKIISLRLKSTVGNLFIVDGFAAQ